MITKSIIITAAALLLAGCGHNINVQGWGIACPYGAMGYGTFSCVRENVTVKSTETVQKEGVVKTTNLFTVGQQANGYTVQASAASGDPAGQKK